MHIADLHRIDEFVCKTMHNWKCEVKSLDTFRFTLFSRYSKGLHLVDIAVHANDMIDIDHLGGVDPVIRYKHFSNWTSDSERYLASLSLSDT